jgi:hypothetical protein
VGFVLNRRWNSNLDDGLGFQRIAQLDSMAEALTIKGRGVLGLLAGFVVLISIYVIADTEMRLNFLADDAFYVTIPAKHYVESGEFPSLDGKNPTNGFHPMIFIIDVLFAKAGVKDIYIANMVIGVGFHLLTAWLFLLYASGFLSDKVATWLTAGLLVNPFLIASAWSGLESTLFTSAIIVYYGRLFGLVNGWCKGEKQSWQTWLIQGLLGILCYLCRTEFLFHMLGHAMAYFILWCVAFRQGRVNDIFRSLVPWLTLVVPPTIAFFLYGTWGKSVTGHFTQSSASQKSVIHELASGNFAAVDPARFFSGFQDHGLMMVLVFLCPFLGFIKYFRKIPPGLLFILCSTFAILFFYSLLIPIYQWHYMASYVVMLSISLPLFIRAGAEVKELPKLYNPLLVILVVGLVAWVYATDKDDFYQFRNLDLVFGVIFAVSWIVLFKNKTFLERHAFTATCAGILALCSMVWFGKSFRNIHYYRVEVSEVMKTVLPENTKVGVAAAGIYAKFLDEENLSTVVNLDGAISWPTLEAIRESKLNEFIDEQGIDVLLEAPPNPKFTKIDHFIQLRSSREDLLPVFMEVFPVIKK